MLREILLLVRLIGNRDRVEDKEMSVWGVLGHDVPCMFLKFHFSSPHAAKFEGDFIETDIYPHISREVDNFCWEHSIAWIIFIDVGERIQKSCSSELNL